MVFLRVLTWIPHGAPSDRRRCRHCRRALLSQMTDEEQRDARVLDVALNALSWAAGLHGRGGSTAQGMHSMQRYYQQPINVAVAGRSGSGKSSFINAMLGLSPGDPGAAAVGVCETTMRPTCYHFPHMPNFKLWDIPGADTQEFASETYTKAMGLTHFDMVVIIVLTPYTGTERTIALELERCGIPHFIVRTKVDIDIDNNSHDHDMSEHETLAAIREDMLQHDIDRPYLVSARRPHGLDMDRLMHDLVQTVLLATCEQEAADREQRAADGAPVA